MLVVAGVDVGGEVMNDACSCCGLVHIPLLGTEAVATVIETETEVTERAATNGARNIRCLIYSLLGLVRADIPLHKYSRTEDKPGSRSWMMAHQQT